MPQEKKEFSLGKLQKTLTLPQEDKTLNTESIKSSQKSSMNKKPFFIFGIILLLATLIASAYYFVVYKPQYFYVGKWEVQLSQEEKDGGARLVKYDIKKDEINADINTDQSGLVVRVVTNTKYEIVKSTRNEVVLKVKEGKLSDLSITIPSSLCENNCEDMRKNLEDQLKKAYDEEFKKLKNTTIKKTSKGITIEDGKGRSLELKKI